MDEQRAEFEAWAKSVGWPHSWGYSNTDESGFDFASWDVWQAATQRQQERIAELESQVQALSLDAGRWRFAASHTDEGRLNFGVIYDAWDGDGSFTDQIDTAIAAGKGEG